MLSLHFPYPPRLLGEDCSLLQLLANQLHGLIRGGTQPLHLLTTGRSKEGLTATAALHELGSLAHDLSGIQSLLNQGITQRVSIGLSEFSEAATKTRFSQR